VETRFRNRFEALHKGLYFIYLSVWALDEGVSIERVWDGDGLLGGGPFAKDEVAELGWVVCIEG